VLTVLGLALGAWVEQGQQHIAGVTLDTNTILYAGTAVIVGFQALIFGLLTRVYGMVSGFLPRKQALERFTQSNTLEKGLVVGILVFLVGVAGSIFSVIEWSHARFGLLVYPDILRIVIPSAVAIIVGFQVMLAAFFLSVLMINRK